MAQASTSQLNTQISAARSAGYNDNQIKSYLTQKGYSLNGTPYESKPGGIKGFLINNLPAITGGLATIASAPLELGDLVTGVGGTAANVAVGAAGSSFGEGLKEKLLGQNLNAGQIIKQGVEGGALNGIGAGLSGGRTAAKAAFEGTGDAVAQAASKTDGNVVSKFLSNQASKTAAADTEKQAAIDTAPYSNVPTSIRSKLGMNNLVNYAKSQGMGTDPESLRALSNARTGENGAISGTFRQILGNVGSVDTSGVMPSVDKELGIQVGDLGSANIKGGAAENARNQVLNILDAHGLATPTTSLGTGGSLEGALTKNVAAGATIAAKNDPNSVFDAVQDLGKRVSNAPLTDVGQARASVLGSAKTALEDSLYKAGGVDDAVANFKLTPEDEDAIKGIVAKQGGSDTLAQSTIDDINGAKTGQEMRSLQANDVKAGQLADAADKANSGALPKTTGHGGGIFNGSPSGTYYGTQLAMHALHNPLEAIPLGAHHATQLLGKLVGRLAPTAAEGVEAGAKIGAEEAPTAARGVVSTLRQIPRNMALAPIARPGGTLAQIGKQIGGRDAGTALASVAGGTPPGSTSPSSFQQQLAGTQANEAQEADQASSSSTPFNSQNIENAIMADIALNGGKNVSMLTSLYNTFGSQKAQSDNLTTDQQNDVVANSKATSVLNAYMGQLGQGSTGPIAGRVSELFGNVLGGSSADAKAIASQRTDVAATIASTLSPTGRPAASITGKIAESLPSVTDSAQVQKAKYDDLIQRIQAGEFSATTPVASLEGTQ
jgi:hypothetical protein